MKQVYVENNLGEGMDYDYDLKYEDGKTVCLYSNNSEWTEHLHGQTKNLALRFLPEIMKFEDYE